MDMHSGGLLLDPSELAMVVAQAQERVVLACPGVDLGLGAELARAHERTGRVLVVLDPSPELFRLGYGELKGLEALMASGCPLHRREGLRLGCLVADDDAFFFSPVPLLVEPASPVSARVNGYRVLAELAFPYLRSLASADVLDPVLLAPSATPEPQGEASTDLSEPVTVEEVQAVKEDLALAPPQPFDMARQVRVYQAQLVYVELALEGCSPAPRKVTIPPELLPSEGDPEFQRNLETRFLLDLKEAEVNLAPLEQMMDDLRREYARDLRMPFGRVVLRRHLEAYDWALDRIRLKVAVAQSGLLVKVSAALARAKAQAVAYCLPAARSRRLPPPGGWGLDPDEDSRLDEEIRRSVEAAMEAAFPAARDLVRKMKLHEFRRDLTWDSLQDPRLLERLKKVFPEHPWERAHSETLAAAKRRGASLG